MGEKNHTFGSRAAAAVGYSIAVVATLAIGFNLLSMSLRPKGPDAYHAPHAVEQPITTPEQPEPPPEVETRSESEPASKTKNKSRGNKRSKVPIKVNQQFANGSELPFKN